MPSNGMVAVSVKEIGGGRNKGRFTSAGLSAQRERNRRMAQQLQGRVASLIDDQIIWRTESTGRLVNNTEAPENATSDTWSLAVGNPTFLNASTSKYWRTVEQGSAATWKHPFIGTHLWGRFGKGGKGGGLTGFWTDTEGTAPFVVRHEIEGKHAYPEAATQLALREFAVRNIRLTLTDILG
jgi:hypothetical protein